MKILKDRKWQIVIAAVIIVIIVLVIILLLQNKTDKKEEEKKTEENNVITEKQVQDTYGMSSSDAIAIIKPQYNDDNYEYTTTITMQGQYEVSVKNKITDSVDKYLVDPATKAYYILDDSLINAE